MQQINRSTIIVCLLSPQLLRCLKTNRSFSDKQTRRVCERFYSGKMMNRETGTSPAMSHKWGGFMMFPGTCLSANVGVVFSRKCKDAVNLCDGFYSVFFLYLLSFILSHRARFHSLHNRHYTKQTYDRTGCQLAQEILCFLLSLRCSPFGEAYILSISDLVYASHTICPPLLKRSRLYSGKIHKYSQWSSFLLYHVRGF